MDAVPGRVNVVWNLFDKPGEYRIQCREYCGYSHADMRAKLFVEPFVQTAEAGGAAAGGPNATAGNVQTAPATPPQSSGPPGTPLTILSGASGTG